jgi:hypothetical protein
MAKTKIEVDLVIKGGESVEQVENKTKSLKAQLKEMKALLASGTLDSEAFNKLSAEAGKLQDKIGDVNAQVQNLASDSQKLDGFISLTQGIVGGFAAVQGITAMVGKENEDLQETMVKLQGAMSALAGIQAVANTLNKTSAAYTTANTIATNISTFAQKQYAVAVGTSTGAMKIFRIVMASLGIGLVIAAIGYLVANFDKLKTTVTKFLPSLDSVINGFKAAYNAVTDFLGITNDQTRAADKLTESSKKLLETQKNELEVLKAGNATKKQIYLAEYKMLADRVAALDKIAKLNKKYTQEEAEERAGLIQEIKLLNASYLKEESEAANERAKASKEAAKKRQEEKTKQDLEDIKNRRQILENEKEFEANLLEEDRLANEKEEQRKREDTAFNVAWSIEQYQYEKAQKKKIQEQALADQKVIEEARLSIMRDSYLVINNLGELAVGQQFKNTAIGKTLALTQIAIDTAMAISSLTKNSQANPTNAVTGGISGIAQFASGMVQITGNMLKAKSILNGGGNVSTGGGGASGSAMGGGNVSSQPPRLDTFQSNRTPMNANQRVYVLEKDITDSQGRVARIRHNATLI